MLKKLIFIKEDRISAILGTALLALINLIIALLLMKSGTVTEYGTFAFIQVMIGLIFGLSNALFSSPMLILFSQSDGMEGELPSYFYINILFSMTASCSMYVILILLDTSHVTSFLFSVVVFLAAIRWFIRGVLINLGAVYYSFLSDAAFTLTLIICLILNSSNINLEIIGEFLITSFFLSLLFTWYLVSKFYSNLNFLNSPINSISTPFLKGFKRIGKHALIGVSTTELSGNLHSYAIVACFGTKAFAPIGIAMLMLRPISLINMALTQAYRPKLAKEFRQNLLDLVEKKLIIFSKLCLSVLVLNIFLIFYIVIFEYQRFSVFDEIPINDFYLACILCVILLTLRTIRTPNSAFIQCANKYHLLSKVTIKSAALSACLVTPILMFDLAILSILGVIVGELFIVYSLHRLKNCLLGELYIKNSERKNG